MSRLTKALQQWIQEAAGDKASSFVIDFNELCKKYKLESPIPNDTEEDKKKKRKYPDNFDELSPEQKEELAKNGFGRITKRRKKTKPIVESKAKDESSENDDSSQKQDSLEAI
jgi:hypothetical protein